MSTTPTASSPATGGDERLKGYRGTARAVLERFGVGVWSEVEIDSTRGQFRGLILPRSETADDKHIVLKIASGYNIGILAESITHMVERGRREAHYKIPEREFPTDPRKPNVMLFGTGGTIASRLDYRTGAVIPAFSPGELYGSVPELADICNLRTEKLFAVFSENMGPQQYITLARRIGEEIEKGTDGIVIGHGRTRCTTPRPSSPSWSRIRRSRSSWSARSAPAIGLRRTRPSI